jgi:hypothetical protein
MSSDVVFNCATCFKTVKGKQHYAICVSCSSRVHRTCYDGRLSNSDWTTIRPRFTCAACQARSRGNYCSDGERQLVTEQSIEKTLSVSTYVPPTTVQYEILIGASIRGGDIVSDGCGYTYGFYRDYPCLRIWRCTFRGSVNFPCCNFILKQITRPGIDFLRNYSQEDFTLNAEQAHTRHPRNYNVHKQQLTVGQSCSTTNEPSRIYLEGISTAESARVSADVGVSIDY